MKSIGKMTQLEFGAYVQTFLRKKGIDVVLSGGAAVSFYTQNRYISRDLDLIRTGLVSRKNIKMALEEVGFIEEARYFKHPSSIFLIEFPEGPLSAGSQYIAFEQTKSVKMDTGDLRILSSTDCVKDRLAAYIYFKDHQSLNQAIMVSKNNKIDLTEIERWLKAEGANIENRKILSLLSTNP